MVKFMFYFIKFKESGQGQGEQQSHSGAVKTASNSHSSWFLHLACSSPRGGMTPKVGG